MKKYFALLLLITASLFNPIFGQTDTLLLDQTMTIGSVTREYHLFLPDTTTNAPIVLLFHGHSNTNSGLIELDSNGVNDPSIVAPYKKWLDIAQQENIILIVPYGYNIGDSLKGWNDCRSDGEGNSEEDDVLFVRNLIDSVVNTYSADSTRVYANGTSNGGHFCIRLAEEIPDKITAFAAVVASNAVNSECATGTLPVSAMFINGTGDPLCPYYGGQMANNRGEVYSTDTTIAYWIQKNGTNSTPIVSPIPNSFLGDSCTVTKYEYLNGNNNTCVVLYKVDDGGHTDPSPNERYPFPVVPTFLGKQNGDIEMAQEAWNFFKNKSSTSLSIEESLANPVITLYPNPATEYFSINYNAVDEINKIELLNFMGQSVKSYEMGTTTFDLNGLSTGTYFIRIEISDRTIIKKLIIE